MELGRKIYHTRTDKNITQKALAKKIGISIKVLDKWENCELSPEMNQMEKIAKALNISVSELLDNDIRNLIKEEILNRDSKMEVIVLTKRLDNIKKHILSYGLFTLKQMFYIATSKVCVVDSYCIPVSVLKHKKGLSVLQIWHSLGAIKEFGYQTLGKTSGREKDLSIGMNMHKNYNYVLVTEKTAVQIQFFAADTMTTELQCRLQ